MYEEGATPTDIASHYGISLSTVYNRLHVQEETPNRRKDPRTGRWSKKDIKNYRHPDVTDEKLEARMRELNDDETRLLFLEFIADVAESMVFDDQDEARAG